MLTSILDLIKRNPLTLLQLPPAYYGLVILLICAAIYRPILLSELFFLVILRQAAPLGMVVLGQAMVIRCRSIDLSVGGVILAINYLATSTYLAFLPDIIIIVLCALFGVVIGLINGLIITLLKGSAVIITLAMSIILIGLVSSVGRYTLAGDVPALIQTLGSGRLNGIPIAPMIWIAITIPLAIFLRISVYGRYLDAVGSNLNAATLSGISYVRVMVVAHMSSGLFTAIGALLLTGFIGTGSLDIGRDLVLNSIAAVILGGVIFGGGRGRILGPTIGAFMLTFLFNFLTSAGFDDSGKLMMQGAIIACAALMAGIKQKESRV